MKVTDNRADGIKIAYIGGGSRGWAWTFMTELALEPDLSGDVYLYDIDKDAAGINEIIGNSLKARDDAKGKWDYHVSNTLEDALTGADFVILSILPKTFDEMEADVHMPERLGIYQSVGDTAGPGGIMRALRTLPVYLEFGKAIKQFCPDAWVINYTNPMSLCVKALYTAYPEIRAFGCCHEVFGTQKLLADIAERELHIEKPERKDIHVNVLGINHFTWFESASYKGTDLFPVFAKYTGEHFEEGFVSTDDNWIYANPSFACAHRVKMDLFRRYGLIAAAGDRHLAEFMPGDEYLKDPETVSSWKFGLTPVSWRKKDLQDRLARSARLAGGEEIMELKPTGEEGVLMIKALCGLGRMISNVNVPNTYGQIQNLPENAVVETNALFERDALRPIMAGKLPEKIKELTMPHILNHERIMDIVLEKMGDVDAVTEVMLNDPLVKGRADREDVRSLVTDMMKATLPEINLIFKRMD